MIDYRNLAEVYCLPPGTPVTVADEINGVIERVVWVRGMVLPLYLVEWWHDGDVRCREFHASEVAQRRDAGAEGGLVRTSIQMRPVFRSPGDPT